MSGENNSFKYWSLTIVFGITITVLSHYIIVGKYLDSFFMFTNDVKENLPNNDFYIINVAAVKTESEAKTKVQELKKKFSSANYLWIPDYPSLSGANYYCIFIGPYSTQQDCEVAIESYKKIYPKAYGLLVSKEKRRVQINGIGKIIVSQ